MKILNLYAGIGGNRELWGTYHEITAVEFNSEIAKVYNRRFPNDTIVVGDALSYLLNNYRNFDFIWASPPCQTHSTIINSQYTRESYNPKLPDMTLYQIILFLQGHGRKTKWVVENVKPYYTPLIPPTVMIDRHLYWSNFNIPSINIEKKYIIKYVTCASAPKELLESNVGDKRQAIRNQVNGEVAKYILEKAKNENRF